MAACRGGAGPARVRRRVRRRGPIARPRSPCRSSPRGPALRAAGSAAGRPVGPRYPVARDILAIAGQHELAVAAGAIAERRLRNVLLRHPDFAALLHVGQTPLADHLPDRLLDMRLVATQEALAVDGAAPATARAPIDQLHHVRLSAGSLAPVTTTCGRAGTTRRAGAPASRCSPWRPCARRSSGASRARRRTPSR